MRRHAAPLETVFVEVPEEGRSLSKGDEAAVVESVKAASAVYAPVSGTVLEGNAALADTPEQVGEAVAGAALTLTAEQRERLDAAK